VPDITAGRSAVKRCQSNRLALAIAIVALSVCYGCKELGVDTASLLMPRFQKSEVYGFVAGLGTTFAAMPDLVAMLRQRSTAGMHPRMASILVVFQVVWIYYGLLINSRPVIAWNLLAVLINSCSVGAYFYFARREKGRITPPRA
jgi:uncharacterized protein with PQ loop repeat